MSTSETADTLEHFRKVAYPHINQVLFAFCRFKKFSVHTASVQETQYVRPRFPSTRQSQGRDLEFLDVIRMINATEIFCFPFYVKRCQTVLYYFIIDSYYSGIMETLEFTTKILKPSTDI